MKKFVNHATIMKDVIISSFDETTEEEFTNEIDEKSDWEYRNKMDYDEFKWWDSLP